MGTVLITSRIRARSNVFNTHADSHLWENNALAGPLAGLSCSVPPSQKTHEELRLQLASIGELSILDRWILVAADIPAWAITTGRFNDLASCLRRFRDTFLFVNEADRVLRLGGHRLGNLSIAGRGRAGGDGWHTSDLRDLRLKGGLRAMPLCDEQTFRCPPGIGHPRNGIDCTDYTDHGRHLIAFTASNALLRSFNYATTLVLMLLSPLGIGQIDSHGGYFLGRFCLDQLFGLALRGVPKHKDRWQQIQTGQKEHCMSWIRIPSDGSSQG